jgi:hypothetical protein
MKKKELQDGWTSLSTFIKNKCTFDVGSTLLIYSALYLMCDLIEDDQDTDRISEFP